MPINIKKNLPKLDFNITNRCNFRCFHCCFTSGELEMSEFSIKKIEKILKQFKELGGWRIDITGGEPLMRKDIKEIITLSKELNLKTELVTNASLLNKKILKEFKKLNLDGIAISLDGSIYNVYSKIRPISKIMFKKVLENIKNCVEFGFYTKINTVIFKSNFDDLVNISKLAIKLGVNEHGFYYFSPIGRGEKFFLEIVNPLSWLKIVRTKLIKLKDKIKFSLEVPIIEKELADKLNIGCFMENPWHLQILPDGNVYPCAIMASYNRPLGNLYQASIKDIWQEKKFWNGTYYKKEVLSLFKKFGGCVNYPSFSHLIKSNQYKFVCLCRKFSILDLILKPE